MRGPPTGDFDIIQIPNIIFPYVNGRTVVYLIFYWTDKNYQQPILLTMTNKLLEYRFRVVTK